MLMTPSLDGLQHFDVSPLSDVSSKGSSAPLARFCHECGSPFPGVHVRFCCDCGVRRLNIT